jgi:5'-nucleotidase (lipoprotein e(P4) family)
MRAGTAGRANRAGQAGRFLLAFLFVSLRAVSSLGAQDHLEIKYVRDSEEYWTLVQQVYRAAGEAVARGRQGLSRNAVWGVVLDVDETSLDNSPYQLDRAAYGVPFDSGSWNGWVRREEALAVPGAVDFVRATRLAGGRLAFVTNRDESTRDATRRNLAKVGLWQEGDRLCLQTDDRSYSKVARRGELRKGAGRCAWEGQPLSVIAYVGDQMTDFPSQGEEAQGPSGPTAFGTRYFLLPQPMYGAWTTRVTRPSP